MHHGATGFWYAERTAMELVAMLTRRSWPPPSLPSAEKVAPGVAVNLNAEKAEPRDAATLRREISRGRFKIELHCGSNDVGGRGPT